MERAKFRHKKLIQFLTRGGLISEGRRPNLVEIAKRTGLHKVTISRLISGEKGFNDLDSIEAFADGFHVPTAYFFTEEAEETICMVKYSDSRASVVRKTIEVLNSDTEYAESLNKNIESFHSSIMEIKRNAELEGTIHELRQEVGNLKKRYRKRRPKAVSAHETKPAPLAMDLHKKAIQEYDRDFMIQQIAGKIPTPLPEVKKRK